MEISDIEFEKIIHENKSTIYSVCYMFSEDADEVDDLFQEVLINLWKGFGSFKGESKVKNWIWRVSFNTCFSQNRKKKDINKVPLTMDINLFDETDEDNQQIQMLYRRIHRLKPFDRAIVLLWLEGMHYEEIAAIVGISVKNVSVRLYRIKEELKKSPN
jgi:RNA polymerase sigma-70 factor (ECF subfamily)